MSVGRGSGRCDSANAGGGGGHGHGSRDTEQTLLKVIHDYTLDSELKTCILSEATAVAESGCSEFNQRDL